MRREVFTVEFLPVDTRDSVFPGAPNVRARCPEPDQVDLTRRSTCCGKLPRSEDHVEPTNPKSDPPGNHRVCPRLIMATRWVAGTMMRRQGPGSPACDSSTTNAYHLEAER